MKLRSVITSFAALAMGSAWATAYGCGTDHGAPVALAGDEAGATSTDCPAPAPAAPVQLTTYDDVLKTLEAGSRVRVVMDYAKCTLAGKPGPDAVGAMNIDTFEYFGANVVGNPKPYFAASENHLIRFGEFLYDYVKVKVTSDGSVEVDVVYLKPTTFEIANDVDEKFTCTISDGKNGGAVTFFKSGM